MRNSGNELPSVTVAELWASMKGYLRRGRELVRTCVPAVVPNPSRDWEAAAALGQGTNFLKSESES